MKVDLNCDIGESFGVYKIGRDAEIMPYITSANIACGFHAGDPDVMKKTVQLAAKHGTAIGAHPGFQDLAGFGRRSMALSAEEVYSIVVYQIGALQAFVRAEGLRLQHVKPHGALYNMASADKAWAEAIARAVKDVDNSLILFGLAGSKLIEAGKEAGLTVASEVFADRTYTPLGDLTPRRQPNALIEKEQDAARQAARMVKEQKVRASNGTDIDIQADTICIHGDGPHALQFVRAIREALSVEKVQFSPPHKGN